MKMPRLSALVPAATRLIAKLDFLTLIACGILAVSLLIVILH